MRMVAVGDVMTRNFISVKPSASLYDCAKELVKGRVNSLGACVCLGLNYEQL